MCHSYGIQTSEEEYWHLTVSQQTCNRRLSVSIFIHRSQDTESIYAEISELEIALKPTDTPKHTQDSTNLQLKQDDQDPPFTGATRSQCHGLKQTCHIENYQNGSVLLYDTIDEKPHYINCRSTYEVITQKTDSRHMTPCNTRQDPKEPAYINYQEIQSQLYVSLSSLDTEHQYTR